MKRSDSPAGAPADGALSGVRVTVMGLGLHGGGLATTRYLCSHGAEVTVTDLRTEEQLASTLSQLGSLPVRLVLGRHEDDDFRRADIVLKNPAVPRTSRYLQLASFIETDISLFLRRNPARVIAVTGTKGKSTTAGCMHDALSRLGVSSRLGGNITVSPLTFVDELTEADTVVLELSSFQLGDLLLLPDSDPEARRAPLLQPEVAVITNLMHDHMDYYTRFEDYFADKAVIFSGQPADGLTLLHADDEWGPRYAALTPARPMMVSAHPPANAAPGAWIEAGEGWILTAEGPQRILPREVALLGEHNRKNLLYVAAALRCLGHHPDRVADAVSRFAGIPHRMELVATIAGVRWYNDSAATIAEAALAAAASFDRPVRLIGGGSDKGLDVTPFRGIAAAVAGLYLLAGTGTERIAADLREAGLSYHGPFPTLEAAVTAVATDATAGEVAVLSPGCASFGMFRNEFHRGDSFRELVRSLVTDGS